MPETCQIARFVAHLYQEWQSLSESILDATVAAVQWVQAEWVAIDCLAVSVVAVDPVSGQWDAVCRQLAVAVGTVEAAKEATDLRGAQAALAQQETVALGAVCQQLVAVAVLVAQQVAEE